FFFFFSSRRRHTRSDRDWSSDVCSSDLGVPPASVPDPAALAMLARRAGAVDLCGAGRPPRERRGGRRGALLRARLSRRRHPSLRSEEHTSELQSRSDLVCRLLLEKNKPK